MEVSPSSSTVSPSRFSGKIRSTVQNAIKQEMITSESFRRIFETAKQGLFQKHCFCVKDMKRPLSSVILEAIENFDCLLDYIISSYEEGMTSDSLMLKVSKGIENSEPEAVRTVGAFTPNTTDIMQSFMHFFNC